MELYGKSSSCLERMDSSRHQHDFHCIRASKFNKAWWRKSWGKVIFSHKNAGESVLLPSSVSLVKNTNGDACSVCYLWISSPWVIKLNSLEEKKGQKRVLRKKIWFRFSIVGYLSTCSQSKGRKLWVPSIPSHHHVQKIHVFTSSLVGGVWMKESTNVYQREKEHKIKLDLGSC